MKRPSLLGIIGTRAKKLEARISSRFAPRSVAAPNPVPNVKGVDARTFFPGAGLYRLPTPKPIYGLVAVRRGTTRSSPETVFTQCTRKVKCGTVLTAVDGHPYVVVQRKIAGVATASFVG